MNISDFPLSTFILIITTTVALLSAFTITVIRILKKEVKEQLESYKH